MIKIEITEEMRDRANKKAEEMGQLKNSIMKGEGNTTGFLGEEIVLKYLRRKGQNTHDHDLIYKGKHYDVKTKLRKKDPVPEWDCSIAAYNTVQKCDGYIFVSLTASEDYGWILGWMPKEEYFEKAVYWPKNKYDPSNGYKVRASCYNLKIKDLKDIGELSGRQSRQKIS